MENRKIYVLEEGSKDGEFPYSPILASFEKEKLLDKLEQLKKEDENSHGFISELNII